MVCNVFLAKKYIKEDILSIICATVFTSSKYIFVDIFYRAALGESMAIIFYLVLLIGIYNMLYENYSKPWLFSIAFLGILFSHITTLLFAIITLFIVVIFNCKKLFFDKKFWIKSSLAFGVFLLIGLYFIITFIEMYFADTYQISNPWTTTSKNAYDFLEILGITSAYSVGLILFSFAFLLRIILIKIINKKENQKLIDKLLIISLILVLFTSKLFPWKLFDCLFGSIQFPWRVNFIISILLSVVICLEIKELKEVAFKWSVAVVIFIHVLLLISNSYIHLSHTNSIRNLDSYSTRMFEWYPVVTEIEDFKDRNIYDNSQNAVEYERKEYTTDLNFVADGNDDYYIVPIVCYKGYEATLIDENGKTLNLAIERCDNGMTKIFTNKQKGKVYLHYAGTTIQNVTFWISFMGTLVLIVSGATYAIVKKKRKHN